MARYTTLSWKNPVVLAVLAVMGAFIVWYQIREYLPLVDPSYLRTTFQLAGVVVDEQGNALDGVRVRVSAIKQIKLGFESERTESQHVVDRRFDFRLRACSHVTLWFGKDGYELNEMEFSPVRSSGDRLKPVREKELRVVLRKRGR